MPYVLGTRPRFVLEGIGQGWRALGQLPGALRRARPLRDRADVGAGERPVRAGRARPHLPDHGARSPSPRAPCRSPRSRSAAPGPAPATTGPRAFATGSAEDVTVREYRQGDDLRRVHWRSSAKLGELMVRREEQPWQSRATLFLDNRVGRPPRPGHRVVARGRGLGGRVDRGPPDPPRLRRTPGHRDRRGARQRLARPRRRPQHRSAARGAGRRPGRPASRGSTPAGWARARTAG